MDDMEDEEVKEIELGRGNRMRKETNYDDRLSERDWLKAIGVSLLIARINSKNFCQNFTNVFLATKGLDYNLYSSYDRE